MDRVVLPRELLGDSHKLSGSEFEAFFFESADYLAG